MAGQRRASDCELTSGLLASEVSPLPTLLGRRSTGCMCRKGSLLGEAAAGAVPRTWPLLQVCLRWFDRVMMAAVFVANLLVILSTIPSLEAYHRIFYLVDTFFVSLFVVEFLMRMCLFKDSWAYLFDFFGVIDMLSCIPVLAMHMLSIAFPSNTENIPHYMQFCIMLQLLRTLRVFRVFKLDTYAEEFCEMEFDLLSTRVFLFLFGFSIVSLLFSAVIYVIEGDTGDENFSSIPACLYWTVVTVSTVGYGDVVPSTVLGKAFAVFVITLGYGAIVAQGINISEPGSVGRQKCGGAPSLPGSSASCQWRDRGSEEAPREAGGSSRLDVLKERCLGLSAPERAQLSAFLAERVAIDVCSG